MVVIFGIVALLLAGVIAQNEDITKANEEVCNEGFVDAATRTYDGSTYLFRGDYYWKINGGIMEGYPRLIKDDWTGVDSGPIDAAFTWNDGSTFIFQGSNYWRYYNQHAEKGYPRQITDGFRGIPNDIDAALVWNKNGHTYFFKGGHYWRYIPEVAVPTHGHYPASISAWHGVPINLSAAIRWEGGKTYFFKGTQYYRYENDAEVVTNKYPIGTGKAWFECPKNETETKNFERLRRHVVKDDSNELVVSIDDLKASMEMMLIAQKQIRSDINDIKMTLDSDTSSNIVQTTD